MDVPVSPIVKKPLSFKPMPTSDFVLYLGSLVQDLEFDSDKWWKTMIEDACFVLDQWKNEGVEADYSDYLDL
jgi:hypothetical protein